MNRLCCLPTLNVVVSFSIFAVAPALSQPTTQVAGDDLNVLANGRSWGISYYGDPNHPATTMVWDFRKNGSVCARPPGGKKGDKCMDEGKWNVRGEAICWELTWMGEAGGFKANCFSVKKISQDQFQMDRQKEPNTKFAVFRVLK